MGKFDGILFCTDLDGTLLKSDKSISDKNIDAIEYFKANGGLFTIMTGRMSYAVGKVVDIINPNVPIGFGNGLGIYNLATGEKSHLITIDNSVLDFVRYVYGAFPEIGIELNTHQRIYTVRLNDTVRKHFADEGLDIAMADIDSFDIPIAKVLFAAPPETLDGFIAEMENSEYAHKFQLLRSDKYYYEVLPKDVGKGDLLIKLRESLGEGIKKVIAAGDNDNDVSMVEAADFGVAVENAVESVKNVSDIITVSNDDDAIAKVIYDLDKIL